MSAHSLGTQLRERLRSREPMLVVNIDYTNASLVEFLAGNGADVIFIDCEQGDTDLESIPDLVRAAHIAETPAIVRLHSFEPAIIERYMFRGVDGIVVPRLDTPDQAKFVVEVVRYCFPGDYEDKAVIVQIESLAAVRELDAFLAIEGIDAFFIGPVDLAKSMGKGADFSAPEVKREIDRTITSITRTNRPAGMLVDAETIEEATRKGVTFLYLHTNDFIRFGTERFIAAKKSGLRSLAE